MESANPATEIVPLRLVSGPSSVVGKPTSVPLLSGATRQSSRHRLRAVGRTARNFGGLFPAVCRESRRCLSPVSCLIRGPADLDRSGQLNFRFTLKWTHQSSDFEMNSGPLSTRTLWGSSRVAETSQNPDEVFSAEPFSGPQSQALTTQLPTNVSIRNRRSRTADRI